jgi:hypothetical protein
VVAFGRTATAWAGSAPTSLRDTVRAASARVTVAYPPKDIWDSVTTGSPTWNSVTPSPRSRTVPATSRPGTKGGRGYPGWPARSPRRKKTSTRPTAAWLVSMLICPGPGFGSGNSAGTRTSGPPNSLMIIACTGRLRPRVLRVCSVAPGAGAVFRWLILRSLMSATGQSSGRLVRKCRRRVSTLGTWTSSPVDRPCPRR